MSHRDDRSWNHLGVTSTRCMTSSWQNWALGRSHKEPAAGLSVSLAKFEPPYRPHLYNNDALPPAHIAAIIRGNYSQPKRNVYIPISPELHSKTRYSRLPRNSYPFRHPFPTNRPRNDDRADCSSYMHLAYARVCVCMSGGLCEKLCVCVRCIRVHVRGYARARVATVELCSNCAKLRISVGDELRDLQYNCAGLLSPHVPSAAGPVRAAAAPRPKELQPRSRYVHTVRCMCIRICTACKRVRV